MGKFKRAICIKCGKPLKRHDEKRVIVELPSNNRSGAKGVLHLACSKE